MAALTSLSALEIETMRTELAQFLQDDRETHLERLFGLFDLNASGTLDESELRQVMTSISGEKIAPAVIHELVREADLNGDGVIDIREFCLVMHRKRSELSLS
jgi:Ca2+-binding EF-hand superfamily protein